MKKIIALILTLALLMTAAIASAQTFRQGIDPEYPPFTYLNENGEYAGFDVDVCKAACELLGWEYETVPVDWGTKEVSLNANEIDCVWSGMTIRPEMIKAGFVISTPYYENKQVILTKEGNGIASSADLAGKVVAVQASTSADKLLSPAAEEGEKDGELLELAKTFQDGEPKRMQSYLACATELDSNGADAIIVDLPVAYQLAAQYKGFVVLDEVLGNEQYGILFRAGDEELCKQIDDAVAQLVASGKYAELLAKEAELDPQYFIFLQSAE